MLGTNSKEATVILQEGEQIHDQGGGRHVCGNHRERKNPQSDRTGIAPASSFQGDTVQMKTQTSLPRRAL